MFRALRISRWSLPSMPVASGLSAAAVVNPPPGSAYENLVQRHGEAGGVRQVQGHRHLAGHRLRVAPVDRAVQRPGGKFGAGLDRGPVPMGMPQRAAQAVGEVFGVLRAGVPGEGLVRVNQVGDPGHGLPHHPGRVHQRPGVPADHRWEQDRAHRAMRAGPPPRTQAERSAVGRWRAGGGRSGRYRGSAGRGRTVSRAVSEAAEESRRPPSRRPPRRHQACSRPVTRPSTA